MPIPASRLRQLLVAAFVAAAAGVAACRPGALAPETARAFDAARAFQRDLAVAADAAPRTARDTGGLVALAYLERARVGVGSPFRLVDFALNDPRLPQALRDSTAWAILAMTWDGATHAVDPHALHELVGTPGGRQPAAALAQQQLLERTVLEADDVRVGEHAVRLAYDLMAAEGLVRGAGQPVPARLAAQLRDRRLAREDLRALLRAARDADASPVRMVPSWRIARRFAVEQPVLAPLGPEQEVAALAIVPALVAELRTIAATPVDSAAAPLSAPPSLLSPGAAAHFVALPQSRALPPDVPVIVTLTASRDRVVDAPGLSAADREARVRFAAGARTEETLVAHAAQLGDGGRDRRVAQAVLWAATSVRPYAQEEPWFPGSGGPTPAELRARFGVAAVSFDRDVPVEWRPYYRRLLASAMTDLRRVLPDFSIAGMGVHFGQQPLAGALAVHDPRTRTVFVPLGTGAGALAHELAHDLDYQVAVRTLGRRGEYSTDQAVREQRGTLAASLRGLTSARLVAPGPENQFRPSHAQRPTEVFAASVDWFVAAGLARQGRLNGYLSSVQDELFTGFAEVRPPDANGDAGEATVAVLAEMTTLPAELEAWFRASYGRDRTPTAFDRARRVLELSATPVAAVAPALPGTFAAGARHAAPACVALEVDDDDPPRAARRRAAMLAAEASARRTLATEGLALPGGVRVPLGPDLRAAAPIDPAIVAAALRDRRDLLLARVQRLEDARSSWLPSNGAYVPYCE